MMKETKVKFPKFLLTEYPFDGNFFTNKDGHKLHYVDEGKGDVVLMLHGNPTWSFYYRNLIKYMHGDFRCIALDHLGCGLSDKPQDYNYCLENHINNARCLIENLNFGKFHLVLHDWGCAIGMALAEMWPECIESITIMNGAAFLSNEIPKRINFCRTSWLAKFLVLRLNLFAIGSSYMAVNYPMSKEIRSGYLYPYNSKANRIATLRFVQDIPMDSGHRSWNTLKKIGQNLGLLRKKKALILWSQKDFCFTESFLKVWIDSFDDAHVIKLNDCGHYVLEDSKALGMTAIRNFLLSTKKQNALSYC
ncbi:MAG: alpha/beta fold hydrolase [Puniceicoccales bacterium]|jgi:haloalkane dehalogenase|nr:alpha/beta fold hydrolase [Puniceicoccales bacterium]